MAAGANSPCVSSMAWRSWVPVESTKATIASQPLNLGYIKIGVTSVYITSGVAA